MKSVQHDELHEYDDDDDALTALHTKKETPGYAQSKGKETARFGTSAHHAFADAAEVIDAEDMTIVVPLEKPLAAKPPTLRPPAPPRKIPSAPPPPRRIPSVPPAPASRPLVAVSPPPRKSVPAPSFGAPPSFRKPPSFAPPPPPSAPPSRRSVPAPSFPAAPSFSARSAPPPTIDPNPPPPAPPPPPPPIQLVSADSVAPAAFDVAPPSSRRTTQALPMFSRPVPSRTARYGIVFGAASLAMSVALATFLLVPRTGGLRVAVVADRGTVARADVYVDGTKRCENVPCLVTDLPPGSHAIQVDAPGFARQARNESIDVGKERLAMVELRALATSADELRATSSQRGVRALVDGKDRGALPLAIRDLSPGKHQVRFVGGDGLEPTERTVDMALGRTLDLGDIKLKVLRAKLTVDAPEGAASVAITPEGSSKPERVLKGPFPTTIEVDATRPLTVTASQKGARDVSSRVAFDGAEAEKTVNLPDFETSGSRGRTTRSAPRARAAAPAAPAAQEPASGGEMGRLNLNSVPLSKVLLDGRPLGSAPRLDVEATPGTHTVTFVHPELGRKTVSVTVKAGGRATAAVRFNAE